MEATCYKNTTGANTNAYNDTIYMEMNACYGRTTGITVEADDIPLDVNECYSTNTPMKHNTCYESTITGADITSVPTNANASSNEMEGIDHIYDEIDLHKK